MVDRDLILRKLADLQQYLEQVSEYRGVSVVGRAGLTHAEALVRG